MLNNTLLIIIGFVIVVVLMTRGGREKLRGICAIALDYSVRKRGNKETILSMFADKPEITREDVQKKLEVSRSAVIRYMGELENEGRVIQEDDTLRGVVYRLRL